MTARERDEHTTVCPQCSDDAEWSYLDSAKTLVEVMCSRCGRFEMTREEFDQAMEDAEVDEMEYPPGA